MSDFDKQLDEIRRNYADRFAAIVDPLRKELAAANDLIGKAMANEMALQGEIIEAAANAKEQGRAAVNLFDECRTARKEAAAFCDQAATFKAQLTTAQQQVTALRGALKRIQHIGETQLVYKHPSHGEAPHEVALIADAALAAPSPAAPVYEDTKEKE